MYFCDVVFIPIYIVFILLYLYNFSYFLNCCLSDIFYNFFMLFFKILQNLCIFATFSIYFLTILFLFSKFIPYIFYYIFFFHTFL